MCVCACERERTCEKQSHGATVVQVLEAEAAVFFETTADYAPAKMETELPGALLGSTLEMERFASLPVR